MIGSDGQAFEMGGLVCQSGSSKNHFPASLACGLLRSAQLLDRSGCIMANVGAAGLPDIDGPSEFPSYKVRAGAQPVSRCLGTDSLRVCICVESSDGL